jgi:hypothetical protein
MRVLFLKYTLNDDYTSLCKCKAIMLTCKKTSISDAACISDFGFIFTFCKKPFQALFA